MRLCFSVVSFDCGIEAVLKRVFQQLVSLDIFVFQATLSAQLTAERERCPEVLARCKGVEHMR